MVKIQPQNQSLRSFQLVIIEGLKSINVGVLTCINKKYSLLADIVEYMDRGENGKLGADH